MSLRGDIDLHSAEDLRAPLAGLDRPAVTRIVIDLGAVAFCDSVGLSAFVDSHRRCRAAGGFLRLAAATPFLQRVLSVVGLLSRSRSTPPWRPPAPATAPNSRP